MGELHGQDEFADEVGCMDPRPRANENAETPWRNLLPLQIQGLRLRNWPGWMARVSKAVCGSSLSVNETAKMAKSKNHTA